jgi:glycosyltransferase involved in cell wall biosynthesis
LRALAAELAPRAITFHGFLERNALNEVASACDVFALLPLDEPFGLVFTEAMSRGLLCIGPDHGGPNEILEGGALGWTIDPFAPEALETALDTVHGMSTADADRRRAASSASVQSRFSARAMVGSLRSVLREHGVQ